MIPWPSWLYPWSWSRALPWPLPFCRSLSELVTVRDGSSTLVRRSRSIDRESLSLALMVVDIDGASSARVFSMRSRMSLVRGSLPDVVCLSDVLASSRGTTGNDVTLSSSWSWPRSTDFIATTAIFLLRLARWLEGFFHNRSTKNVYKKKIVVRERHTPDVEEDRSKRMFVHNIHRESRLSPILEWFL